MTRVFPAPTVNFQNVDALSTALPDKFMVITVPVFTVPEATNRQTDTQTPSAAAPPTVLVYSPNFVQVPVPPLTDVWSLLFPSTVDRLSVATISIP